MSQEVFLVCVVTADCDRNLLGINWQIVGERMPYQLCNGQMLLFLERLMALNAIQQHSGIFCLKLSVLGCSNEPYASVDIHTEG